VLPPSGQERDAPSIRPSSKTRNKIQTPTGRIRQYKKKKNTHISSHWQDCSYVCSDAVLRSAGAIAGEVRCMRRLLVDPQLLLKLCAKKRNLSDRKVGQTFQTWPFRACLERLCLPQTQRSFEAWLWKYDTCMATPGLCFRRSCAP
jgi:hypothetical protein